MLDVGSYRSENLFFEAVRAGYQKPYWLIGVEPASPILDVRGVDALAQVTYPGHGEVVHVPVQIKGNWEHAREYYRLHPSALHARVVVLVISYDYPHEHVRRLFFEGVERVRAANVRYDTYLANLEKQPVTGKAKEVVAMLTERRARQHLQFAR